MSDNFEQQLDIGSDNDIYVDDNEDEDIFMYDSSPQLDDEEDLQSSSPPHSSPTRSSPPRSRLFLIMVEI
jgi:hypothetical protein